MGYTHEPAAMLSFLLVLWVRKRWGIAIRQTWMNHIEGDEKRQSRFGWQLKCCGHSVDWKYAYRGFATWQLTAVSLPYHPPATRTKTGIFRIMSIIYASCLPSGYNQKPPRASSHTECDLSAESPHTVFQTRQTVTINAIWKTSVSVQQNSYVCNCSSPSIFVRLLHKVVGFFWWVILLQDLRGGFQSRQRWRVFSQSMFKEVISTVAAN